VNKFWGEEGNIFIYLCIVFIDKCVEEMRQIDEEKIKGEEGWKMATKKHGGERR
jgi:hypothetical protein